MRSDRRAGWPVTLAITLLLLCAGTVGLAGAAAPAHAAAEGVRHRAFDYGSMPRQQLGAHWDPRVQGKPWLLLIHGGYWDSGSRASWDASLSRFTDAGYAVFAMDYQYSTTSKWPGPRKDAELALRWIRAHATAFGIHPGRAVAVGWSVGGQIALALASADHGRDTINAAVALSAPASPYAAWKAGQRDDAGASAIRLAHAALTLHGAPPDRAQPAVWKLWVSSNVRTRLGPGDAPSLLVHSVDDPFVPIAHSRDWVATSLAAGVPSRVVEVPGRRHGSLLLREQVTWDEVMPFLDRRT